MDPLRRLLPSPPLGGVGLLIWLALLCFPLGEAQAQNNPTAFQAQQFRPWMDPQGMFQTQSARTLGQWKYKVGLFLNYSKDPLIFRDEQGNRISDPSVLAQIGRADMIGHQLGADLVAGIGLLDWLDVALVIPFTIYQDGGFPTLPDFGANSGRSTSGAFFSDIKIGVMAQALKEKKHFVSLGLQLYLGIPTGNKENFNGDDSVSFGARLLLSRQISIVHLALNFGYRFQTESRFLALSISQQFTYSLAAAVTILPNRLEAIADIGGATEFLGDVTAERAPLEVLIGARIYPWKYKDLAVMAGFGLPFTPGYGTPQVRFFAGVSWAPVEHDKDKDGTPDGDDKCISVPGPKENKGCPWPDTDADGLKDNVDKCPKKAGPKENSGCPWPDTDKDGLNDKIDKCPKKKGPEANRGCPWPDTDKDGLHDKIDLCPNKAGPKKFKGCPDTDKDGLHDKEDLCPNKAGPKKFKGCPDTDKDGLHDKEDRCPTKWGPKEQKGCPVAVIVVKKRRVLIKINDKIFFKKSKATILSRSFYVLNNVARLLKQNPKLRIRVEGHTDNSGSYRYNMRLSYRRARSVRDYLRKRGVSRRRLRFRGYGYRKPIATNRTVAGRAKNRRVEFVVLNRRVLGGKFARRRRRSRRRRRRYRRRRRRRRSRKKRRRKRSRLQRFLKKRKKQEKK